MPGPAPSGPPGDRNLLFGILAVQLDFVSRDALIAAMNAWVLDKTKPLGRILVDQGSLKESAYALLDPLVDAHIHEHDCNPQKSLAAINAPWSAQQMLKAVDDADVQASLARVSAAHLEPVDPFATTAPTMGTPTSTGLRFRILRPHDKGALGEVFIARDEELPREVALKQIQERHADNPDSRARFLLEAEVTGGLEHPGVVPVYGLGKYTDGRPFYAMRFIKGDNLKEAIKRFHGSARDGHKSPDPISEHNLEFRQLLRRFIDVCNAIAYAHSRGVLHRDLKPGNIMLGKYGETLVVDWGLAKVGKKSDAAPGEPTAEQTLHPQSASSYTQTMTGATMGTPAFMSPEQASGQLDQLGPASDVYSLGATLYMLLTGRPPITGEDAIAVLSRARRGDFLPPAQAKNGVAKALDAICRKAMALKPEDRYAGALDLAADVEHWLADEPVQAYREPWSTRAGRWVKRHRLHVASAAALVLAAIPLSVVIAVISSAARQRAEDDAKQIREQRDQVAAVNDTLRLANYIADMNLAQHAWEENNLVRTRQLLDQHRPKPGEDDLRGFEWHYLNRLFHRDQLSIQAHGYFAESVVFTPDGKRLFSCGKARALRGMQRSREVPSEIKLWDAATGQQLDLALDGSTDAVRQIALSPDGTYLGAACRPGGIQVWNLATHQRFDLKTPAERLAMAVRFSPDSKRLVASFASLDSLEHHEDEVRVYDLLTRDTVWTLEGLSYLANRTDAPAFSPDSKYLAIAHVFEDRVRVVEAATGKEVFSCKYGEAGVSKATFSPDGKSLAIGGNLGLTIWDIATHQQQLTCQNTAIAEYCLAYSPDGKQLAMSPVGGLIGLWDARTGQQISTFKGHAGNVYSITFRPDGRYLASAGFDGTVRLWDTTSRGDVIPLLKEVKRPGFLDFSPDRQALLVSELAGASDLDDVFVADATTGQRRGEMMRFDFRLAHCFDWTGDGKHLIGPGDGKTILIYDTGTGVLVHSFPVDREDVCVTAISPDGRWFAHSAPAATIKIRDAERGAEHLAIHGLADEVRNLAFDPDGLHLAGTDTKGWLRVWDVATGRECMSVQIQDMSFSRVRFMPDGKGLAIVGNNFGLNTGDVRILDAATGREILRLAGHTSTALDVAFSPDGQRLATGTGDGTIRIWHARTGQEILTLRGHTRQVGSVHFSADGHRLVSASADQTIRHWDATPMPE